MRPWIILICLAAAAAGVWKGWSLRTESHPPGVLAPDEPFQNNLAQPVELARNGIRLLARAEFDITARVIARMQYRFDDLAAVSPVDFALGWGGMSDSAVLDRLSCSQGQRFYACSWKSNDVIDPARFRGQSANMHLIPDTPEIEAALLRVRQGQIVTLRGLLVDVVKPDGGRWNTSMTREDSGPGGCEIIYVVGVGTA
jgi:hypothetical protein